MVSLKVSVSQTIREIASTKSFKWETHGEGQHMTDHGLTTVPFGLKSGNNKLILLMLMKVNTGYHLISGELSMPKLSIPITDQTGTFLLSKELHPNSPLHNNNLDGCHSKTMSNKMSFLIAFNGMPDFSQQAARTILLHRTMLSSCMIPVWTESALNQEWLNVMVEPWRLKTSPKVPTSSDLFPSMDLTKATAKSSIWDLSVAKNQSLLSTLATHTNEALRNDI